MPFAITYDSPEELAETRDSFRKELSSIRRLAFVAAIAILIGLYSFVRDRRMESLILPLGMAAILGYWVRRMQPFLRLRKVEKHYRLEETGLGIEIVLNDAVTHEQLIPWSDLIAVHTEGDAFYVETRRGNKIRIPQSSVTSKEEFDVFIARMAMA